MIAYGKEKQNAINELLKGKEDKNWPITALLKHDNVEIYTDCEIE
jgi:6-phosphogluconolactonase/glucosamine-6-phosphate isomerase/deaminase